MKKEREQHSSLLRQCPALAIWPAMCVVAVVSELSDHKHATDLTGCSVHMWPSGRLKPQ